MADDIASTGIKIDTHDIERANVSLDTLAGKGVAVDKSLGKIEGAAAKAGKSLDNLGRGAQSAAGIGDVGAKAQHAAQGIRAVGDSAEKAGRGVKSMATSMGGFGDALSGIAMKAAAAAGAFVSVNKAFDAAAQWTDLSNRLKMVADGTDGLARAQAEVVRIAQSTRAPLEATAQLYQRIAQQQDALGMSTSRVAGVVETVSKAMALSGVSAGAANAALVQFGQALASGVLRGDELNSILEQAPGLAMALAEGLGTTTGKLREMGAQGQLTADMVVGALEKQANSINQQFDQMAPTISQALGNVNTAFTAFVGKLDEATGLTAGLARTVDFLAKNFDTLAIVLGGTAIVGAVMAFGGLTAVLTGAAGAAALLAGALLTPIGLAVAAVAGLTAAYIVFKDELNGTGTAAITLGDIFGQVGKVISGVFGSAQDEAKKTGDASADAAENTIGYWEKGIRGVAALMDKLASVVNGTVLGIGEAMGNVASAMTDVFAKAFNWIAEKSEALINKVAAGINATTKFIPFVPSLGQVSFGRAAVSGVKLDVGGSFDRGMRMGQSSYWSDAAGGFIDSIRSQKASAAAQAAASEGVRAGKAADAKATRDLAEAEARLEQQRIKSLKIDKEYQQTLKDLVAMRDAGRISEAEYVKKVEALATATYKASAAGQEAAKSAKDRKKASDEAAKEAEREAKAVESFLDKIKKKIAAQEQELKSGEKLSDADKLRLEYQEKLSKGSSALTAAKKKEIEAEIAAVDANEKLLKLREEQAKVFEKASQDYDKYVRSIADEAEKLDDKNKATREEIDAMGLTARQLAELEKKRLSATIAAKQEELSLMVLAGARDEEVQAILRQIAALEERKALIGEKSQQQEMLDAQAEQLSMWQSIDKTAHDVFVNIFEDGAGTFKRLGQTLKAALLDWLYQMTVKRWIINIGASMSSNPAAFAQSMGGSASMLSGGGNAISSIWSLMNGSSITNMATGWISNLGAGMGGEIGAKLVMNSEFLGSIVGGVGNAFAGYGISKALSGGYSAGGWVNTAAGAASAIPGIGPIAGVIGGLVNRAFGRKHAQHNLEGVFGGATGFEGNWHDYWKGGMFRSSKTENTPLDSATLNALRGAWKAQEAMVIDYAETLGLATDKIEGFTFKINLKLKDLGDPEAAGYMDKVWQMVNEAIATGSNEMAERIIGTWTTTTREVEETIKTGFWDDETFTTVKKTVEETTYAASEYAREGERAIDTLTRLATSLQATNAAFDMLGLSLYEASLAGGDMASKLIDQMGGMDAFGAQVGAYWQNYYTEAERHAYMTAQMTEALAAAGLEMPTTVAGFRALVDAQDLTTDAGRAAFTALMSVNAAFTEVYGNADAAAGSIADLGEELAALEPIVFGAASDLAGVIEQGLLGTLTGAQLGEQMADVVMQGMYSAIAGGFSQQITALMVEGVLNPMIAAAMTGASMSAAVSQAAIDRVIQHAQAAAAAINAVLSDPGFQAAIQQVQAAVGSISVGIQRPEPIYDSYAAQHARELAAQREAERMADEAQRAADQRAREAQQLAEQQAREAQRIAEEQAREAQRLADEEARYWQAVFSERQGLLKQLWTLEGNVAAVRQMELEALDPSNRALQTRIWQLQDEKEAVEKYNAALKNAQEFLSGFTRNITEFIFKVSHAQADAAEGYQLAAAKFSAQLVLARGGDRDALGSITGYADTLIESIRRESATGAEANLRIARVLGQLGELPQQVSAEQLIVDAIASGTSTTVNALSNLQSSLINELIGGFDQIDATMDGKLSFSELQTALAGKATDAEIAALIARVDTNSDGQISKLEAVRAAAATTATNVGTVNTSVGTVNTSVGTWGSNQYTRLGAVDSSVAFWGNAQTNATNSILAYQSVQTAGTYADFRSDYGMIRTSVESVYDAIRAMHFTDGTNSIMRMRAQVDEVRNNSYPLYVKSEHRAGTMMTFETGGYTGHGGRFEPAGIVHRGEGVLNQDDIRALGGPAGFEALRLSLKRGYADGGLVAPVPFVAPILRQGSDPEIKRLLRELVDEARAKESNDRVRHSTLLNQASRQTEIMERQENIGMPRTRKENAVVV